jgi:lipopolysaccharide transport system permease protein
MLDSKEEIIIAPGKAELNCWKDLWRFRELFYMLSCRDIKVRYKQTVIGVAWSIIRPILTTIIFSNALSKACGSLIGNANLISKVYFPRMIIPASSVIAGLVDFGILYLSPFLFGFSFFLLFKF